MADTLFWNNVNNLIKTRKVTQDDLCNQTGISLNTLRGWISKNVLPRAEEAVAIASALGTTVEYLVTGKTTDNAEVCELLRKALEKLSS